jgi:two-component system, chemotaxis family, protein-glutamate methylesterase/glutaminase
VKQRGALTALIIDDSALVRMLLTTILQEGAGMAVTTASDPIIAMEKLRRARPDVIVLDLNMPRMDGLTFLRHLMATDPIPVVVCSGVAQRGTEEALRALHEGAVDVVCKPRVGVKDFFTDSAVMLIESITAAASARVRRRPSPVLAPLRSDLAVARTSIPVDGRPQLVAIGASTGGTEAIRELLSALEQDAPPVVIVQHMPERFTAAFANQLDRDCRMHVREAKAGDPIVPGVALIAPGNRHLLVHAISGRLVARLDAGPLVSRHRPSVDMLFRSVAKAVGAAATGVLLTGMGEDGAAGLLEMRRAGAYTIAQDEATSTVFGMPRVAIQRGAAAAVLPLRHIAASMIAPPAKALSSLAE